MRTPCGYVQGHGGSSFDQTIPPHLGDHLHMPISCCCLWRDYANESMNAGCQSCGIRQGPRHESNAQLLGIPICCNGASTQRSGESISKCWWEWPWLLPCHTWVIPAMFDDRRCLGPHQLPRCQLACSASFFRGSSLLLS